MVFRYILTIKHVEDYEEFMENIVDVSNAAHRKAYEALKLHQFGKNGECQNTCNISLCIIGSPKPQTSKKYKGTNIPFQTLNNISVVPNSGQSSGKGKKKYTNFYAQDHRPGLIKGNLIYCINEISNLVFF